MKKKTAQRNFWTVFLYWCGALMCFGVGVWCGIYAQSRLVPGAGFSSQSVCVDGVIPDENGCCLGEVYTDMGELGFNCCPPTGDCFPPIK